MCDPVTITGIALTAGSLAANTVAQNRVQSARDDALAAERIRQGTLDKEAEALNVESRERYEDFEGQESEKAAELADYFTDQSVPEPSAASALPTSASNITVKEEGKQRGQAKEFTDRTGTALGALRAFGDVLADRSRLQARDAGTIGQIGGFKRGSSGITPYELDAASQAGGGFKLLGDVLGGAGGVATTAGLSGGNLFGLGAGAGAGAAPVVSPVARPNPWAGMRSVGSLYGGV